MQTGRFFIFKNNKFGPLWSSEGVLLPDADEKTMLLYAAASLFKDCIFEFIPDDLEEPKRKPYERKQDGQKI